MVLFLGNILKGKFYRIADIKPLNFLTPAEMKKWVLAHTLTDPAAQRYQTRSRPANARQQSPPMDASGR